DPDVIMVGEIRDLETAEIAIKAAQTGHMVLSTLHTNDAPQTIARLMNMGIAPYNITSSITLVIAQRLARRLCERCKRTAELPDHALLAAGFTEQAIAAGLSVYEAVGYHSHARRECDRSSQDSAGKGGTQRAAVDTAEGEAGHHQHGRDQPRHQGLSPHGARRAPGPGRTGRGAGVRAPARQPAGAK